MVQWIRSATYWFVVCSCLALAAACGGGASCKEDCSEDSDCELGLACFDTRTEGKLCLPEECNTCFDDHRTCRYSENTDEQADGASAECEMIECL